MLATVRVRAIRAVHAGFDLEKDAGVDGLLNLPGKVDETVEAIVRPNGVEFMPSGVLCFREHVEAKYRAFAVDFLVGAGERGHLKVKSGFAVWPFAGTRLPVADCFIFAVHYNEVEFPDERLRQTGHVHAE